MHVASSFGKPRLLSHDHDSMRQRSGQAPKGSSSRAPSLDYQSKLNCNYLPTYLCIISYYYELPKH